MATTFDGVARAGSSPSTPHFITCEGLGLSSPRVKTYHDVSLDLGSNRAHAICAEDRGGKAELLLTLGGRMHPNAGSATVAGHDITQLKGVRALRREAGLSFFDRVNEPEPLLKVGTIVSAELGLAGKRGNRQAVGEWLDAWDLRDLRDERVEALTRYDYDRLGIALGLVQDPAVLAVHDVERDLTEHQSVKLIALLCEMAREHNVAVVCGVTDYDLAVRFDTQTCITPDARSQAAAWERKHAHAYEEVA